MATATRATIEDLYNVPEDRKAEIVDGQVMEAPPTGDAPNRAGGAIYVSLRQHESKAGGRAYTDNAAFRVDLPHRNSFSPDAAFHTGTSTGMKFLEGAPDFAAEVRSENDYGPGAEQAIARKRADYFAAGALVVWDVDLLGKDVVKVYRSTDPKNPTIYRRGDTAEAEPAVPGWRMAVEELFR
jgi:Uma2 family endonuclease